MLSFKSSKAVPSAPVTTSQKSNQSKGGLDLSINGKGALDLSITGKGGLDLGITGKKVR